MYIRRNAMRRRRGLGETWTDLLYNLTGSVSPAQQAAITAQNAADLIHAGANPATAIAQANADAAAYARLNQSQPLSWTDAALATVGLPSGPSSSGWSLLGIAIVGVVALTGAVVLIKAVK